MTKQEREQALAEKLHQMKEWERELYAKGVSFIAGVDEVGRGPLAGPVVAAAVVLPEDFSVLGIDDSKKISEKKRQELFEIIKEKALAYGIGQMDHETIDRVNILEATKLAMRAAIDQANEMLLQTTGREIEHILFDALTIKEVAIPQTGIIKGDAKSVSIAAASILAKVTRDTLMCQYSQEYPGYGFDSNKGYGTKAHYQGLEIQGMCKIHRRSFLKNL